MLFVGGLLIEDNVNVSECYVYVDVSVEFAPTKYVQKAVPTPQECQALYDKLTSYDFEEDKSYDDDDKDKKLYTYDRDNDFDINEDDDYYDGIYCTVHNDFERITYWDSDGERRSITFNMNLEEIEKLERDK